MTNTFAELRRKGIGGSDVAAIAGLNPWKTPLQVWKEKVLGDTVEENAAMSWGTKLEPLVLDTYAQQTGATLRKRDMVLADGWRMANVDAEAVLDGNTYVVEAKTARTDKGWGQAYSDDVPDHYACQGQWYCDVLGLDRVDFAVLIAGSDFRIYTQRKIPLVVNQLRTLAERFWHENVLKEIPPDPVTAAEANDLWRKSTGRSVTLPEDVVIAINNRKAYRDQIAQLEQQIEEAELALKRAMQDADTAVDSAGKVVATWKTQVSRRLDTARLKAQYSSIYEECCNQTESRVLRVK